MDIEQFNRDQQQYERDAMRVQAHHLALKADEFDRVSDLVRQEVREHARHLGLQINDRNNYEYCAWAGTSPQRVLVITFNKVRFEIEIKSHVAFRVDIALTGDKPIVLAFRSGVPLGIQTDDEIINLVRKAIESFIRS